MTFDIIPPTPYPTQSSVIASIQYGTVSITGTNTSGTATITSVDTSKAALLFLGFSSSRDDGQMPARITLTNATTVTATRSTPGGTGATTVGFCVVEFA